MGDVTRRCYCQGTICGVDPLAEGDRQVHLDAAIVWGAADIRDPWSGSYDFGSFACVAAWAKDRSDTHDGRVLSHGVDRTPSPTQTPPDGETTLAVDAAVVVPDPPTVTPSP